MFEFSSSWDPIVVSGICNLNNLNSLVIIFTNQIWYLVLILLFVTTLHRLLAMSLCMTGSDLSSSSKPWPIQRKVSDIVYAEFHEQGDVEKSLGWKPIPLFDSNNFPELASMQVCSTRNFKMHTCFNQKVGFFGGICVPCYELLAKVMPPVLLRS